MKKYINIPNTEIAQALLDAGVIKRENETNRLFVGEIKFSQLSTGSPIADADIAPWVQGGNNVKQAASANATYMQGKISLQNAYDVDNIFKLSSGNDFQLLSTDADGNKPLIVGNDKGIQIQAPIYSLLASNLNLTADFSGTIFQNSASGIVNTITLVLNAAYPQNSAIFVWANGTQNILVTAQAGVTLDGVDAGTLTVLPGQFWAIYRLSANTFKSINLQPTVGSGISYSGGVLFLTGTGPAAAYGFISAQNLSTVLSYTDFTWKALCGTILNSTLNNFTAGNVTPGDPTTPFYLQFNGAETSDISLIFSSAMRRFSSATRCAYYISASLDGINPISATFGDRQLSYGLAGQNTENSTIITYPIVITFPPGQRVYFLVRNDTTTTPADNDFLNTQNMIWTNKTGDVGGTSSGVVSANGQTGNLTLSSADNTVAITSPSAGVIDYAAQLPADEWAAPISLVAGGATGVAVTKAKYFASKSAGGAIICAVEFAFTPDNSLSEILFSIQSPLSPNFTDALQAQLLGGSVRNNLGAVGQQAQGVVISVDADPSGSADKVIVTVEPAIMDGSVTYYANVAWISFVTSIPFLKRLGKKLENIFRGIKCQ